MSVAASPRVGESTTTTTLLHRRIHAAQPWWSTGVGYVIEQVSSAEDLENCGQAAAGLARAGFSFVVVRPAEVDFSAEPDALPRFITQAHRVGLRVVVRLCGVGADLAAQHSPNPFIGFEVDQPHSVVRARAALLAGADGLDIGRVIETGEDPTGRYDAATLTRFVQMLRAEMAAIGEELPLAGTTATTSRKIVRHHLHEDWLHHLVVESALTEPDSARLVGQNLRETFADRDRLGQVAAWASRPAPSPYQHGVRDQCKSPGRILFMLGLPGVCYLHEGEAGGSSAAQEFPFDLEAAQPELSPLLRRALQVRSERRLGLGSLAWVTGLEWAGTDVVVALVAGVGLVWNLGETAIEVPPDFVPLVSSAPDLATKNTVSPSHCTWFVFPLHRPSY